MPLEYTIVERIILIISFLFSTILGIFKIVEFFESRSKIRIEPYSYALGIRKRTKEELGISISLDKVGKIEVPENILWFKLEFRLVNPTDKVIAIKNIYCLWKYPKYKILKLNGFYLLSNKISFPASIIRDDQQIVINPKETRILEKYYEVTPFLAYCLNTYKDGEREMDVNGGKAFLPNKILLNLILVDTKDRKVKKNFEFFNW